MRTSPSVSPAPGAALVGVSIQSLRSACQMLTDGMVLFDWNLARLRDVLVVSGAPVATSGALAAVASACYMASTSRVAASRCCT